MARFDLIFIVLFEYFVLTIYYFFTISQQYIFELLHVVWKGAMGSKSSRNISPIACMIKWLNERTNEWMNFQGLFLFILEKVKKFYAQ